MTTTEKGPACRDCRFFHARGEDELQDAPSGQCRRYAPRPEYQPALFWPAVAPFMWCGEFAPREQESGATPPPGAGQTGWLGMLDGKTHYFTATQGGIVRDHGEVTIGVREEAR